MISFPETIAWLPYFSFIVGLFAMDTVGMGASIIYVYVAVHMSTWFDWLVVTILLLFYGMFHQFRKALR